MAAPGHGQWLSCNPMAGGVLWWRADCVCGVHVCAGDGGGAGSGAGVAAAGAGSCAAAPLHWLAAL